MSRSIWGFAVEVAGLVPTLAIGVAGGLASMAQGKGFEEGADAVADTWLKGVEKAADYADAHKDKLNGAVQTVALGMVGRFLGGRADDWWNDRPRLS